MTRSLAVLFAVVMGLSACERENRLDPSPPDAGAPLPRVVCLDNDGDGTPGTGDCAGEPVVDCNDNDPVAFPGAQEVCNGRDDTCDGAIDEGLPAVAWYVDGDGDGVGSTRAGEGCRAPPEGHVTQPGDCDDADPAVRPGQAELCNGRDDDCDGTPDNGLPFQDFYLDADGDGFGGSAGAPVSSCQAMLTGRVPTKSDCDDANPTIKPGATELCNKVDDNCDEQVDNGIAYVSYYADVDGDGFGDPGAGADSSCAPIAGKVTNDADCNDLTPQVKPGAPESCNGVDDNCDGQVDEGLTFTTWYADADGDGFGGTATPGLSACAPIPGRVTNAQDCDDAQPTVKPGAPETCNGVDDDCDGQPDDGLTFTTWYADGDGDGFGQGAGQSACLPVPGRVSNTQDCDDGNPMRKPGAPESCNGVDDDCDGQADEGLAALDYFPDEDHDGYGAAAATALRSCAPIAGRVANAQDCRDADPDVHPGVAEACNGVDDDCDGATDEGLTAQAWYPDADLDGHGAAAGQAVTACGPVQGRVTSHDDCDDANGTTHPGAVEQCNGVDDDCDGDVDTGALLLNYYLDADGDGFGAAGSTPQASCTAVSGRAANASDCNDLDPAVKPTAAELCNGGDDDCDGATDEGLAVVSYYLDGDGDGYGAASGTPQPACGPVAGRVANNLDCDDTSALVRPGVAETCNGGDDDCDGATDEGLATLAWYVDGDGDGFGAFDGVPQVSCRAVTGRVSNNGDCNDGSALVRPTAGETCNGVDDNCSGATDEGNPGGGGACATGQAGVCSAGTLSCTGGSLTCVRTTAPSTETCNTRDDDCDGATDEGFTGLGASCTAGQGVCARAGVLTCNASGTGTTCSATAGAPTAAACDGLDNDCDGVTDEPVLTATADVSTTAWQDLEVRPYFHSDGGCGGGAMGSGTDALAGGALVMAGGASGIAFRRLDSSGLPVGGTSTFTSEPYHDVDFAQAGDGFVVAGVWADNDQELDLYLVDANGSARAYRYTQFRQPAGCDSLSCHRLDSLRVVRGNGRRVTLLWREEGVGLRLAQVEACLSGTTWSLKAPGCATSTLTATTLVADADMPAGVGADSSHVEWTAAQTCSATTAQRRLGVAYRPSPTAVAFFRVDENGANKEADTTAYSVTSPRTLAEPDVTAFRDAAQADQFFVAYVTKDPGATTPEADLNYWLTNDPTWHYAYLDYASQAGVDSISRPRVSASATRIWLSAMRAVPDASTFKKQVMTRATDLLGNRAPLGAAVELSVTTGSCAGDPACRPGDKAAFTNWAPFGRLFYSGSGTTPAGSFASALSCH